MREINEEFLKENLKVSVNISSEFRNELLNKLGSENTKSSDNLLYTLINMVTKYNQFLYGIVTTLVIVTAAVGGYMYYQSTLSNIGKVYISEGSVEILRGGMQKAYTTDTVLKSGDVLITKDNSVVDVKYGCTRVAMDNNSQVKFNPSPSLASGTAFISTCEENELDTSLAKVLVNGAALISHVAGSDEISASFMNLIGKAYATEVSDSSTKIITINGDVSVKPKINEEVLSVKTGEQIIVSKEIKKEEFNKDDVNTEFVKKVSQEYNNDNSEIVQDLTAPVLTIVSPENGSKSTTEKVTVTFKSNEDGWYYTSDGWKEMIKDKEYSRVYSLKNGDNKLEVIVKDKGYNKTKGYVTVKYTDPTPAKTISWVNNPVAQSNGVYMKWTGKNLKVGSLFKIYRNGALYKSYTINSKAQSNSFLDTSTTKGKTYSYQISVYESKTVVTTSKKSVVAKTEVVSNNCKISLYRMTSSSDQRAIATVEPMIYASNIKWILSGDCPEYSGYKVVWSSSPNPVYPGGPYHYFATSSTTGTDTIPSGTWYVRVGLYDGSIVDGIYSNQIYGTF